MEPCPYCQQMFKRVKTHLHYCKQKPGQVQVVRQTNTRSAESSNQQCPYCHEVFIRVNSHLPYCKRKPQSDAPSRSTRSAMSFGQMQQQSQQQQQERCPFCGGLFVRLKTHLHYCPQKLDSEEHARNRQMHESYGKQQCPYCKELFVRLNTHLHYCKQKLDSEEHARNRRMHESYDKQQCPYCKEFFVRLNAHLHYCKQKLDSEEKARNRQTQESSGKQQCPYCKELFTRVKTHLHYCKQKPVCEKPDASRRKTDTPRNQQCPHCSQLFVCLKKHLPYCKSDPDRQETGGCFGTGTGSCDTRTACGEDLEPSCQWPDYFKYEDYDAYTRDWVSSVAHVSQYEGDDAYSRDWVSSAAHVSQYEDDDAYSRKSVSSAAHVSQYEDDDAYSQVSSVTHDSDSCGREGRSRAADADDSYDDVDDGTSLVRKLSARLRDARVDQKQPEQVTETVDLIKRVVLGTLNGDDCNLSSVRWKASQSDSYCELQKTYGADGCDLIFSCKANCVVSFRPLLDNGQAILGNYVALKANEDYALPSQLTDGGWICPKAFFRCFRDAVDTSLEQPGLRSISRRLDIWYETGSPAVTLVYTSWSGKPYCIDLVPAIELDGFPPEAERVLRKSWIPKEHINHLCSTFHVVARIHPSERDKEPSKCRLWRLSFSAAEKAMLYRADGQFADGYKTCRKAVLRLLKTDLLDFYAGPTWQGAPQTFTSYHLKMIMLSLNDQISSSAHWARDTMLLPSYVDALRYWKHVLADRHLPCYFIKRDNLLEESRLFPEADAQLRALHDHVSTLLTAYGDETDKLSTSGSGSGFGSGFGFSSAYGEE